MIFTGTLVSKSKDICTPNGHGQNTATKGISAHESKQAEYDLTCGEKCVPHNTQPNVTDSESNNRSVNQAGNTSLLYDRNHNGNMAVSDKEQYSNFSLNQDIEEDAVHDAPDALNCKYIIVIDYLYFNLNIKIQKRKRITFTQTMIQRNIFFQTRYKDGMKRKI